MENILIFSGTTEGKRLAYALADCEFNVTISVATAYGEQVITPHKNVSVHQGRLDASQMTAFIEQGKYAKIVDATHPYAQAVSAQLLQVCTDLGKPYLRLLRDESAYADVVTVETTAEAAAFLAKTEGNVLLTTGSKELSLFTAVPDYKNRLFARVLSTAEVAKSCESLGFVGKNLIMMQGPFTQAMNHAMLTQIDAKWMVTKEGGVTGGFPEKMAAAQQAGVRVVVIARPKELSKCYNFAEVYHLITGKVVNKTVTLVGIGMGNPEGMTLAAQQAIENAGLVIGSGRMLDGAINMGKTVVDTYRTAEMIDAIANTNADKIAVVLSGDVGFYSAAMPLRKALQSVENVTIKAVSGISSVVYLCNQIGTTWQDAHLISLHGRAGNLPAAVNKHTKVFAIVGGGNAVHKMLETLCEYALGDVTVHVGFDLSYPAEKIITGTANALVLQNLSGLCAVLIENEAANDHVVTHGLPDTAFIRGEAPMTKEEIRAISLSKMRLTEDAIVYDVGAGTGSVALEMARVATKGHVYAIERKAEACDLIEQNRKHLHVQNLTVVRGLAPQAFADLPVPTHVFIGGSSGNMHEIVQQILVKNPKSRFVINTVTLESVSEATDIVTNFAVEDVDIAQISVAKSRKLGKYNLMTGGNPVYIYSFSGKSTEEVSV